MDTERKKAFVLLLTEAQVAIAEREAHGAMMSVADWLQGIVCVDIAACDLRTKVGAPMVDIYDDTPF